MRQILSERMLATGLVVALAYLLVFQGIAGAFPSKTPLDVSIHVMCGTSGAFEQSPVSPVDNGADCPCTTLCRLASAAVPVILAVASCLVASIATAQNGIIYPEPLGLAPLRRGLLPDARGPPPIS
jgi:hypothetical protein